MASCHSDCDSQTLALRMKSSAEPRATTPCGLQHCGLAGSATGLCTAAWPFACGALLGAINSPVEAASTNVDANWGLCSCACKDVPEHDKRSKAMMKRVIGIHLH